MILLDTNVVSELMRPKPEPAVSQFLRARPLAELFLPSLCEAEIRYGLALLPTGKRRADLEAHFDAFVAEAFRDRILAFDSACAAAYARARSRRSRAGRPVVVQDALIGGMAMAYGATLVTRNIADFTGYGLTLVNPWKAP